MIINRIATAVILVVVVIVGGVLALTDHTALTYAQYFRDVSLAVGLLGIGYGIDAHSKP